jgi:hypothetical protein
MAMCKEFKEFVLRGNVLDMAVGIIIGAAFGSIISSLVADVIIITPGREYDIPYFVVDWDEDNGKKTAEELRQKGGEAKLQVLAPEVLVADTRQKSKFGIAVSSEVMAILAVATDLKDMRERMGRIVVAYDLKGKPITSPNAIVQTMFTVELKNMLLTAVHDLDLVRGGLTVDAATGTEIYKVLGGGDQALKPSDMFIRDEQGILRLMLNNKPLFQYGPLDQGFCLIGTSCFLHRQLLDG